MKHNRFRNNKRGQTSEGKKAILMVLIIAVLGILAWQLLLKGILTTGEKIVKCGSPMTGAGECRERCETTELGLEGLGCGGITKMCCIQQAGNMGDVILPAAFGTRTSDYDFKVLSISIDESALSGTNCEAESDSSSIRCLEGSNINLPIKIHVRNTAANQISVYATPVYVINGNGDKIVTDAFKGAAQNVEPGADGVLITNLIIESDQAILNDYWEIYPYAMCDMQECKAQDTSSRGIYRKDTTNSNLLTIKFVTN